MPLLVSDEALVQRCHRELPHGTDAYEQLARRYEKQVFRACLALLGNRSDAEDVSQEVLLAVFHGLKHFRGDALFRTWLYSIVRIQCRQEGVRQRRWRRPQDLPPDALGEPGMTPVHARTPSASEAQASVVLQDLSPTEREVLLLRHITELSLQEIADLLELSLSATKMRLYRAEARFRERFGGAMADHISALIVFFMT